MSNIILSIQQLFKECLSASADRVETLPASGSNRAYNRIKSGDTTYIATYNSHVAENESFFYLSNHFLDKGINVPAVLAISEDRTIYIQEDVGRDNLLEVLQKEGTTDTTLGLFKQSLSLLAKLQIEGDKGLNYDKCLVKRFSKEAILNDLLYFKYYFLDTLNKTYNKEALSKDFETLSTYLSNTAEEHFMFRDFQSRNIMVKEGQVYFIDFQGGMKGPLQYDVASLLWQAKANLSKEWKDELLQHYITAANEYLPTPINTEKFISQYNGFVLIRLLQVLGAYGFRGLFERKAHFISSIPFGLQNLQFFIQNYTLNIPLPELNNVLNIVSDNAIINRFMPVKANEQTPLMVHINSFSYRVGIPADESNNGGGFVFDMRGILNPGRFDDCKHLTGLDKPVQEFLASKTKMPAFLNSVWSTIDITIEDYLSRGFESLQINFGCTGGQHRSVYAAEQTAKYLQEKYNLKLVVKHTNRENWNLGEKA